MGFLKANIDLFSIKTRNAWVPVMTAVSFFLVFFVAIFKFSEFNSKVNAKDEKSKLSDQLFLKKSYIEQALYNRIYYTKGVAAYITINPDISNDEFDNLAKEIIKNDSLIGTMSIARNCVINAVYPLKGHEAAIGLDLLKHPKRRRIVESTIQTNNTFIAGPVELIEGGSAIISYTPIFTKESDSANSFWGVTDIVILTNPLFNEAKLFPANNDYYFALKGVDGDIQNGACFFGDSLIFTKEHVSVNILLPTGNWILAGVPKLGWKNQSNKSETLIIILYLSSIIISILIWLLTKSMLRVKSNETELSALFGAMQDLIIEFNREGRYIKIAPTNDKLLIKPRNELLGRTVFEIFEEDAAEIFHKSILKCFDTKQLVVIDYPLLVNNKVFWFHARLSYISNDSVIYVAHDNTDKKINEDKLIESEKRLLALNATKDKFFSIIAHDLKSPLGSYRELTKMLFDSYDSFSNEERIEIIEIIKESSANIYNLLENLLEWSRSQSNKIKFTPTKFGLVSFVDEIFASLTLTAQNKGIKFQNSTPENIDLFFDPNIMKTILRNLISNAIKFTNFDGLIIVSARFYDENFVEISVADNGIGMNSDTISNLFKIENSVSTPGTNNEIGTGLGLILCKEFIEKQGGIIWVASEVSKGSTFYFTIPISV